jgi:hypothetical protein
MCHILPMYFFEFFGGASWGVAGSNTNSTSDFLEVLCVRNGNGCAVGDKEIVPDFDNSSTAHFSPLPHCSAHYSEASYRPSPVYPSFFIGRAHCTMMQSTLTGMQLLPKVLHRRGLSLLPLLLWFLHLMTPARSDRASVGLSDPDIQPKFVQVVPNPLDPKFLYDTASGYIEISVNEAYTATGLVGPDGRSPVLTKIWGYGTPELGYTWPGRTFQVQANETLHVKWHNRIPIESGYLLTGKNNGDDGNYLSKSVSEDEQQIDWCCCTRFSVRQQPCRLLVVLVLFDRISKQCDDAITLHSRSARW